MPQENNALDFIRWYPELDSSKLSTIVGSSCKHKTCTSALKSVVDYRSLISFCFQIHSNHICKTPIWRLDYISTGARMFWIWWWNRLVALKFNWVPIVRISFAKDSFWWMVNGPLRKGKLLCIYDQGSWVRDFYNLTVGYEQWQTIKEIGIFIFNIFSQVFQIDTKCDSNNNAKKLEAPPFTPAELVKLRPTVFIQQVLDP